MSSRRWRAVASFVTVCHDFEFVGELGDERYYAFDQQGHCIFFGRTLLWDFQRLHCCSGVGILRFLNLLLVGSASRSTARSL